MIDLTPIQRVGDVWIKRDDLYQIHGARGGKARTCWALAQTAKIGLTTAGSRHSPQVHLVAVMAKALGLPSVMHVPKGDVEGPVAEAKKLGSRIIQYNAGYNSVIIARSRKFAKMTGYTEIPFGMECEEAVTQTRAQVARIPSGVKRIVVPVGSGMSLCGILFGLLDIASKLSVIGIMVGADPIKRLDKYAPLNWYKMVQLIKAPQQYQQFVEASIGDVHLDPVYEAKCHQFLQQDDLLWVVGHR